MGRKDLLITDRRIIVFANDCFWHGHKDCPDHHPHPEVPAFWKARAGSIRRLNLSTFKKLTLKGWTVVTVWPCQDSVASATDTGKRRYLPGYVKALLKEIIRLRLLLIR